MKYVPGPRQAKSEMPKAIYHPSTLDLNLSAWIERRAADIGPYADHILKSVKEYEAEITRLRTPRCAECDCDNPPKGCNWIKWEGSE